jgi:hypothetical protein
MFHWWQIEIDSQQSIWARSKPRLSGQPALEMGRVTVATSRILLRYNSMTNWIYPTESFQFFYVIISCCQVKPSTGGCNTGKSHVRDGVGPGINHPFNGYIGTLVFITLRPMTEILGDQTLNCVTQHLLLSYCGGQNARFLQKCWMSPENYITDYNKDSEINAREFNRHATNPDRLSWMNYCAS